MPIQIHLATSPKVQSIGDTSKIVTANEVRKRLFIGPLAGDQVRGIVNNVFPHVELLWPSAARRASITAANFSSKSCCLPSITNYESPAPLRLDEQRLFMTKSDSDIDHLT